MATQDLTGPEARRWIVGELVTFQEHRATGLDVAQTAIEMRIPAEAAQQYERAIVRLMDDLTKDLTLRPPSGCRWCGLEEHGHGQRWTKLAGWHGWVEPLPEQRTTRIRALRAARRATEDEAVPGPGRPATAPQKAHDTTKGIAP